MKEKIAIYWFRQDLRVSDNPGLTKLAQKAAVLPIYILDDENSGKYFCGGASRWWLHHSLHSLNRSLCNKLSVYIGNPLTVIEEIITRFKVESIYWGRCYEPWRIERDKNIKEQIQKQGIEVRTFNSSLLWEPWDVKKEDGTQYKVFSPFFRKGCHNAQAPRVPLREPERINYISDQNQLGIASLNLLPKTKWAAKLEPYWEIGEAGALKSFKTFIQEGLHCYREGRNFPSKPFVSRLSPHLHFGEISPNQLWYTVRNLAENKDTDHFCSELGWREFSYSLLYNNPELPSKNLQHKFDNFPWLDNSNLLNAWQKGQTGVPMVDAGMRELWQTGYMHNRVRMIVGSFLVKNLRLHWHHGERWFWDTLVDADLANNSASWQWIAGCGADAAPYFRIFNPILQGQKFDPDGHYVRKYIPEISNLPNKYLFSPWDAPKQILNELGIKLGSTYPEPVIDIAQSRIDALESFKSLN